MFVYLNIKCIQILYFSLSVIHIEQKIHSVRDILRLTIYVVMILTE